MSLGRTALTTILCVCLLTVIGCQSSGSAPAPTAAAPAKAVVVTTNQGSTTVFVPSADGKHAEVLSSTGGPVCADCKAAAERYFLTGELTGKCPITGATRTAVTSIPTSGHN